MAKQFKVTLKRSLISCTESQRETARCIGLRKTGSSVVVNDSPAMRGQIMKLQHLVEVSAATGATKGAK
jgi:large subunit ribosomal protein L30